MKKILSTLVAASAVALSVEAANLASDNAGNYSGGWTNGSNGGSGFGAWQFTINQGTGFAGAFIGNPGAGGMTNFPDPAFGLYANPAGAGASVIVTRAFTGGPLAVGQTFSFQWAVNWDSDTGNKGFNLYYGSGASLLLNLDQAGFPGPLLLNGSDIGVSYGTQPMTWSFTMLNPTTLRVGTTDRNGGLVQVYSSDIDLTSLGAPDTFEFYAANMSPSDNRQPYFNNLQIVPEPSTLALLAGVSALGVVILRRRRA